MLITLNEAKEYLRVDSSSEDTLIESLLESAESICFDVARLSDGETPDNEPMMRAAIFYALAYLYEHREEADHHGLLMSLRAILFSIRESRF
jgi:uncharacterized phage protein (predicted DNA packaging)